MIEKEYIENQAQEMLINAGITVDGQGFGFLAEAITMAYQTPRIQSQRKWTINFYEKIAQDYNSTVAAVERAIRHCIESSSDNGVFKKIPQFYSLWGDNRPTNTGAIKLFSMILKNRLEQKTYLNRSVPISSAIAVVANDDAAIQRAFRIKLLVRTDKNGEICAPWSDEVLNLKSDSKLFYATPISITKSLGENFEFCATVSKVPSKLKFLTMINTYHVPDARFSNSFTATIAGVLKQIPPELLSKTQGFEFVDYNLGNNQLAFSPEFGKEMRFVGARLYTASCGQAIPESILDQPVIYGDNTLTSKNVKNFLNILNETKNY